MRVKVTKDGPYVVSGSVPLARTTIGVDGRGECVEWIEGERLGAPDVYALCRCGHSRTKPFCDGSHSSAGFDGTETADRGAFDDRAEVLTGPGLDVADVEDLCAKARFCYSWGTLWRSVPLTGDPAVAERVTRQAQLCPSGRYVARGKAGGEALELAAEPSIGLVQDPQRDVSGGLWLRGGVPVEAVDGSTYEVRARVTLCRCGGSANKPFCDGAHCGNGFRDGL
jgi:CDGSH-type Zn-finger protein